MIADGQWNNTKAFVRLPALQKTRLPKQDHLDQVCVSLVEINVDSFSSVKVYQQRIWRLHAVMKKNNNFLKKSVSILAGEKLLTYSFLRFPGWKLKKIAETRVRLLSRPTASPLHYELAVTPQSLCPNMSLLAGYGKLMFFFISLFFSAELKFHVYCLAQSRHGATKGKFWFIAYSYTKVLRLEVWLIKNLAQPFWGSLRNDSLEKWCLTGAEIRLRDRLRGDVCDNSCVWGFPKKMHDSVYAFLVESQVVSCLGACNLRIVAIRAETSIRLVYETKPLNYILSFGVDHFKVV